MFSSRVPKRLSTPRLIRTLDFVKQAADARIVVRPYGTDGVRVTIGAPDENDALLRFARDWITQTEPEE